MSKRFRITYRVMLAGLPVVLLILFYARLKGQIAVSGGEVHGSVYALIQARTDFPKEKFFIDPYIFLPDISVYLQNATTSAASVVVTTDLDGTFSIPAQPQAI